MREEVTLSDERFSYCTVGQGAVYHVVQRNQYAGFTGGAGMLRAGQWNRATACGAKVEDSRVSPDMRTTDGAHVCQRCRHNVSTWYSRAFAVAVVRTPDEQAEYEAAQAKNAEMRKKAEHLSAIRKLQGAADTLISADLALLVEALTSGPYTIGDMRALALNLISAADLRDLEGE